MQRFLRVCVLVTFLVPVIALAAAKEKKPRPYIKVDSINTTENTITITDTVGSNKTYAVDSFTTIMVEGKPAKLADVHSGMKVDVTSSGKKASRIEVTEPPEEKAERKKKK